MGTGWLAGGAPGGRRRLGEVLVAGKVLTDAQLNEALRVQREDKGRRRRLGEVITALGLADEVAIARALSDQLGLPFLDLGNLPIPEETLAVLPRNVALRHGAVPVTLAHDVLTVALADPTKVLVLDDDGTIAEIAAAVLVDGYEVVAASHLDEGLRMVESEHPDLILVDLDLPGADPSELLAILRTGARDTPVLFMSADDDHHTRDRAIASGATGFIPKPISEPQLRSEVTAVLQHRAALVDHRA